MKKILLVLAIPAILFSCAGKDEFVLTGTVKGLDGKNIILEKQDDSLGTVAVDTVKIENGKFKFTGTALEPSMHSLYIENLQNKSYLVLENGTINIEINKDSIYKNKVTGTYNNEQLTEFGEMGSKIQQKMKDFYMKNQSAIKAAQMQKDTASLKKMKAEFEGIQKELENASLEYVKKHPKAFISAVIIGNKFHTMTPDVKTIEALYNGLDAEVKNTAAGKNIVKKLKMLKSIEVGGKAPDFSAPGTDGKMVSLKQSMGKVTIIDFWASWCAPCRAANPGLVALYNEYHAKGLNIISVSLDGPGEDAKWKDAIAKDQLTWTHVSNLKKWDDPVAVRYGITEIPKMYLINEQGMIVGKDLKGEALKAKVAELLGS